MLLLIPAVVIGTAGACFLLALASDGFAYGLSRGVEAAFDFFEYRAALRAHRRAQLSQPKGAAWTRREAAGFETSYSHAA
jgi:hypothetical protein